MSQFRENSIFWIEVDKIKPNPFQPRREFNEDKLKDLADSIRQYGLLQPLTVTRKEVQREDGSLFTEYELVAGERRLRASKLAGLMQIPAIIHSEAEDDTIKLELAIIENLQREDLNPIERAEAFHQLSDDFSFKHAEIAKKVGKSREYVSNTIRLLALPEKIKQAIAAGRITEGHARPILMLKDRPEEQETLFKEVLYKKLTVREAEGIARRVAYDKVRKKSRSFDPALVELEEKLAESLGTRVFIEKRQVGGKIMIDFFSDEDLSKLINILNQVEEEKRADKMLNQYIEKTEGEKEEAAPTSSEDESESQPESVGEEKSPEGMPEEDVEPIQEPEEDSSAGELYTIENFSI